MVNIIPINVYLLSKVQEDLGEDEHVGQGYPYR